jgi:hypothetical protein
VHTARRITRQAGLATAVLALAAPTAGATAPDHIDRMQPAQPAPPTLVSGPQASPDISDYAQGRTPGEQPAVQVVRVTREVATSRGFDWDSAGIGAGVVIGIVLVGVGGLMTIARMRRPARVA